MRTKPKEISTMVLLLLSFAAMIGGACPANEEWQPPNLAKNGGFETLAADGAPEGWQGDPQVYSVVTDPVHSGSRALQYVNADPNRYLLCVQPIALQPGRAYELTAWIKTEDIQGEEMGATLCLEWYTADGKYLGGSYPAGFKGTTDWQRFRAISGRVPEAAARCSLLCYLRPRMAGKAWWDDVEVRQWREPPLQTLLLQPSYRGEVPPGMRAVEVAATVSLRDYDLRLKDVALRAELTAADGRVAATRTVTPRAADVVLRVPVARPAPRSYELKVTLERRRDRKVLGADTQRVTVLGAAPASRVSVIDEHNRLIREGKPFFPLGMYWGSINEPDLKLYADSAFNCLMPYGMPTKEQMDLAQRYGLKVIYTVKDIYYGSTYCPQEVKTAEDERRFVEGRVREFRSHPALLAWYLNDELPLEYLDRLQTHQRWLEELDPDHPTWVVLYQVDQLGDYLRTFDAIGTDPYPVPMAPVRTAGTWTRMTVASVRNARPVWMVPQVFNWAVYRKTEEEKAGLRPPTLAELRSMTWQCLAEGARGLIFYCFHDLQRDQVVPFEEQWGRVKQVAAEVRELAPVLLSVEPTPPFSVGRTPWLHWTVRRVGATVTLIAVNDEGYARRATFDLGKTPKTARLRGSAAPLALQGAELTAEFEPFGVNVYEIEFRG